MGYTQGLVSVIVPMYNARETICATIESVLAQDYPNWEIIIADDCSTDDCAALVQKTYGNDSRIHYYYLASNDGVAATRNLAMSKANGQYLAFLDSDDLWTEDKLSKQLAFMKEKNAAFVYAAYEQMDKDGKKLGKVVHVPSKLDYHKELMGNSIPCLTVLIDRNQINVPMMPSVGHEDYVTWLNILKTGVTAYGQNEVLACYRVTGNSLSGNKLKAAVWTWGIYKSQGLPFLKRVFYFGCYAFKALKKHV